MDRGRIPKWAWTLIGLGICFVIAFGVWIIATAIAWGPLISRPDDLPRDDLATTPLQDFCGRINEGMLYPFMWIAPRSLVDGPQAWVLLAVFWGAVLFLSIRLITLGVGRIRRRA
jgi:hypothetical protein